jgi:hypothetical protein
VPAQVKLSFAISSTTDVAAQLSTQEKYLTFFQSPDRTTNPPLLLVKLTDAKLNSSDVGLPILSGQAKESLSYKPRVNNLTITQTKANSVTFSMTATASCNFTYLLLEKGQLFDSQTLTAL